MVFGIAVVWYDYLFLVPQIEYQVFHTNIIPKKPYIRSRKTMKHILLHLEGGLCPQPSEACVGAATGGLPFEADIRAKANSLLLERWASTCY